MKKRIYVDMDGTIADLYNEQDWLSDLMSANTRPFKNAKPMVKREQLEELKRLGYELVVLSATPKNANKEYKKRVEKVKREWIKRHFKGIFKKQVYIDYYTCKSTVIERNSYLIDDEKRHIQASRNKGIKALYPKAVFG